MESKRRDWSKAVPWIAFFALLIALYGAVLSTFQLLDSRAEKARRLDVSLSFDAPIAKGKQFQRGLHLTAVNPGYQVVTVDAAGLILPDGSRLWFSRLSADLEFPHRIAPGDNARKPWAGQDLATLCDSVALRTFTITSSGTVTLIGFYEDGEHRLHKSAPLPFNIEEARKLARAQATPP